MNWKQFKDYVESAGVLDESEIDYIDVSPWDMDYGNIKISVDLNFGVIIE